MTYGVPYVFPVTCNLLLECRSDILIGISELEQRTTGSQLEAATIDVWTVILQLSICIQCLILRSYQHVSIETLYWNRVMEIMEVLGKWLKKTLSTTSAFRVEVRSTWFLRRNRQLPVVHAVVTLVPIAFHWVICAGPAENHRHRQSRSRTVHSPSSLVVQFSIRLSKYHTLQKEPTLQARKPFAGGVYYHD